MITITEQPIGCRSLSDYKNASVAKGLIIACENPFRYDSGVVLFELRYHLIIDGSNLQPVYVEPGSATCIHSKKFQKYVDKKVMFPICQCRFPKQSELDIYNKMCGV